MPNKGQRIAGERFPDERGIDINDSVAETFIGSSPAIMRLVGMQNVALAGTAVPALASKVKGLDARKGNADRVCVVAMRGKSLTIEIGLQPCDSLACRTEPQSIALAGHVAPVLI